MKFLVKIYYSPLEDDNYSLLFNTKGEAEELITSIRSQEWIEVGQAVIRYEKSKVSDWTPREKEIWLRTANIYLIYLTEEEN